MTVTSPYWSISASMKMAAMRPLHYALPFAPVITPPNCLDAVEPAAKLRLELAGLHDVLANSLISP